MPNLLRRALIPILLLLFGAASSYFLCPIESEAVRLQIIGYPNSVIPAYTVRPWILMGILFMPFVVSIYYNCCDLLDRYTLSTFLNSFGICFSALFILIMLEDVQDNLSDFQQSDEALRLMGEYYLMKLPTIFSFILPYSLMLGLLWSLGKMSKNQEIVSMIQTGRSVTRIVTPLVVFGFLCTLLCIAFNYHWAPYADSHEDNILAEARGAVASEARHVAFQNDDDTRHWFVGAFPAEDQHGKPLKSVNISVLKDGQIQQRYIAKTAEWEQSSATWTLETPIQFDFRDGKLDATKHTEDLYFDWLETPFQIINPGLKPHHLGIPGLTSWLANHRDHPLSDKRSYLTHWHYRIAQPFICMITILLAAPLGIVFSRRGLGGGIAVAIFLCAGMVFCSTIFPTLGESGYLSPITAAWSTNILFTIVAFILFRRRATGQPIYQMIKNLFS